MPALPAIATPELSFDPLSAAFAADPYPAYAALRDLKAPWYFAPHDMWLFSGYDDVAKGLTDPKLVRELDGIKSPDEIAAQARRDNYHDMPHHSRFVQFSMLNSNGVAHQRMRLLLAREFTPAVVNRLKVRVESHVASLLDRAATLGSFDFVSEIAARLPGPMIGNFLGVPDEECAPLRGWSEDIVQYFDIDRSETRKALAERTTTEFYHYLLDLSDRRRHTPQDDLISKLIVEWDAGNLSEDEYISSCMLILMAGHGTTVDGLSNGLHALLRFPDQMQRLRDDPSLIPTAVQEMLRYEVPAPFFHRYAALDMELNGWAIPKGTRIGLLYGSANRDETQFANAHLFDIGRTPNRHLAFGGGAHFCLGNHLARLEFETLFKGLIERFSRIELMAEPSYKRSLSIRGPTALQIALTPV